MGLLPTGSMTLGFDIVKGRNLVPSPAARMMACI